MSPLFPRSKLKLPDSSWISCHAFPYTYSIPGEELQLAKYTCRRNIKQSAVHPDNATQDLAQDSQPGPGFHSSDSPP